MINRKALVIALFAVVVALGAAALALGAALAQGGPGTVTDDDVNAVAKQLYCPVCENIPLDVCPTPACAEWRALIREKLEQGWSAEQIKTYFAEQYGDRVLAAPPARGLNWLVYILPPVAILAGAALLFTAFRAWTKSAPQEEPPAAEDAPQDEYVRRLEEELKGR